MMSRPDSRAMLLADLVETSQRVAATSSRTEKVALIAALLRRAAPEEIEAVTAFLAGRLRQGRIGLGWASLEAASDAAAESPPIGDLFADETASTTEAQGAKTPM